MKTRNHTLPRLMASTLALALIGSGAAFAQSMAPMDQALPASQRMPSNPMVGGAAMYSTKDIVDNAMMSKDHTTLVSAVKAAGLVDTLKSPGPFTVFAPTNAAFNALPAGTVDTLLMPANKAALSQVLTYHVVPGRVDAHTLAAQIRAGGGQARLTTVEGEVLTARMAGNMATLTDARGNVAHITTADVRQSNGVIHVIDKVLMPAPAAAAADASMAPNR